MVRQFELCNYLDLRTDVSRILLVSASLFLPLISDWSDRKTKDGKAAEESHSSFKWPKCVKSRHSCALKISAQIWKTRSRLRDLMRKVTQPSLQLSGMQGIPQVTKHLLSRVQYGLGGPAHSPRLLCVCRLRCRVALRTRFQDWNVRNGVRYVALRV